MLCVVVDTEEEFDWTAPFSRRNTSVAAMRHVGRFQELFDRYHLVPAYVTDYPVASQRDGWAPLKEIADDGRCLIGAHLHPWVTPPFDEDVTSRNSYGCNLGQSLERAKIVRLSDALTEAFDAPPRIYKAGRYGFGDTTAAILRQLQFTVDTSVNPQMDFSDDGGPSFAAFDSRPFFWDDEQALCEVPCTHGFVGAAGDYAAPLHRVADRRLPPGLRAVGVLARLGLANKIMLSPEGNTAEDMQALTRTLVGRGVRTFALTLHSPSAEPGHTPYVRTEQDLQDFLDRISKYADFFFGTIGGVPTTPLELRDRLVRHSRQVS